MGKCVHVRYFLGTGLEWELYDMGFAAAEAATADKSGESMLTGPAQRCGIT